MGLSGFTLIELMAVVLIIAIIAAIAYPSYLEQVRRSKRTDATVALQGAQLAQEKFRANCTQYAAGFANAMVCNTATPANNRMVYPSTSPKGYYNLAITASAASTYTITATPQGDQASDTKCGTFAVNESGRNVSGTYAKQFCWEK